MTALRGGVDDPHVADDHGALFHRSEEHLASELLAYVGDGLRAGQAVVVVATDARVQALDEGLGAHGIDAAACRSAGRYLSVEAAGLLGQLVASGSLDGAVFHEVVGGLLRRARSSAPSVRAYGEMVGLLWDKGQVAEAVALELLWCDLRRDMPFELLCGYASTSVVEDDRLDAFNDVCSLHGRTFGPVARLEHKAAQARAFRQAPESLRAARRFVAETLTGVRHRDAVDEAILVVSELAGNAVSHARSGFVVAVEHDGRLIRVTVTDGSPASPRPRSADSMAESGRGLALVAALSARWGTEACPGGKAVWAELPARR